MIRGIEQIFKKSWVCQSPYEYSPALEAIRAYQELNGLGGAVPKRVEGYHDWNG